ncbi:MAG: hypothetical protein ABFS28_13810 [Bacteroidota bacterium]
MKRSILLLSMVLMGTEALLAQEPLQPVYQRAAYGKEYITLQNESIRINLFKRVDGWGWGELYTSEGKYLGILEHLGEIMLRDQDIPVRCVADSFEKVSDEHGESLVFRVKSVVAREVLQNTSFDNWMRYTFTEPPLVGEVTITLDNKKPLIYLKYRLKSTGNYYARYIRGPWLKIGEGSFGTAKEDALLPGVEWAIEEEWTSGTDWFKDPWAMRFVPHPNKVTMPMMAVSHQGTAISLSWEPHQVATRWFNYRAHVPQPVFACPNFIDRMNNQLMGLMVPDASIEGHENEVYAEIPLELKIDQEINFDAEISIIHGNSVDAMVEWVGKNGLPDPGEPRWPYEETLNRIANAYNTKLWHEGEGFGIHQRNSRVYPNVPAFLDRYIKENGKTTLGKELAEKVDWSRKRMVTKGDQEDSKKAVRKQGEAILKLQRDDGSFVFDPEGRHWKKDDFMVATSFIESMGYAGDTALEIIMLPAIGLLDAGRETRDAVFTQAAQKAFEYCMHMTRPEAGDYWETPIHAANLLAGGHAAIGYYEAFREFGEDKYREKAVYWIRTLLAFTHLWEPVGMPMLYNTKPVLSSSDWYFANWVRDHVQWEVLRVFNESASRGIHWGDIDPEIDWDRFREGITQAAIRWMIIHTEDTWRPHNLPDTWEGYQNGDYDYCYPDTHNSTTGMYGGMFIPPDPIATNIYYILDRKSK